MLLRIDAFSIALCSILVAGSKRESRDRLNILPDSAIIVSLDHFFERIEGWSTGGWLHLLREEGREGRNRLFD